ncbi:hypothetical protein GGS26DRAFT_554645 [Hypomontagnella submonticulosa]|nr:hypothetical protein GGS26DRAFT_554645 [Hypomontagnella submonticulosa]
MSILRWKTAGKVHNNDRKEQQAGGSRNFLRVLVDPSKPTVDIVVVHGLNPVDKQSHAEATWTSGDKLWLRDFLPKRAPNARILLFGYNSNVAFQTATAGVREQAENLLNRLKEARTTEPNRPLMFICHSLGGLIVKRALVHSNNDETYESIQESTFGIAFFSTPHRGGNHAGIGSVVAKIARSVLGNPSNTFMDALRDGSSFLDIITDDFRQLIEDFQFLSFYETQPLGRLGVVVDKDSATLGLPGTREKQIALDANHRNICKFDNEEDPRYQQVADNIVKMINDAGSSQGQPVRTGRRAGGNFSSTNGTLNSTLQAGNGNQSSTIGTTNKTHQFGDGNLSYQDGNGNSTIQVRSGPMVERTYIEWLLSKMSMH